MQDRSNSIANAMDLLRSCTKPSKWWLSKSLLLTLPGRHKMADILQTVLPNASYWREICKFCLIHWRLPLVVQPTKKLSMQVIVWCFQSVSHYLNLCWPTPTPPCSVTIQQLYMTYTEFTGRNIAVCAWANTYSHSNQLVKVESLYIMSCAYSW